MSTITTNDVQHLATLSSLQLSDEEVEALRTDLEHIIDYFNQLKELDTTGVEPTYQVNALDNVWRDDTVGDSGVAREALFALSPEQQDNSIKVPQVL